VPFATSLAELDPELREEALTALPPSEKARYLYTWPVWARPAQLPPEGDWRVWLLLSGRGFGKTRAGGEWVREQVEVHGRKRGALVAPTAADVRDIVVEGESGLLAISPPWFRPVYEPSKRRLTWPNGAVCTLYSADEPPSMRGLVELDGVDGTVLGEYTELNPEDWAAYGLDPAGNPER